MHSAQCFELDLFKAALGQISGGKGRKTSKLKFKFKFPANLQQRIPGQRSLAGGSLPRFSGGCRPNPTPLDSPSTRGAARAAAAVRREGSSALDRSGSAFFVLFCFVFLCGARCLRRFVQRVSVDHLKALWLEILGRVALRCSCQTKGVTGKSKFLIHPSGWGPERR